MAGEVPIPKTNYPDEIHSVTFGPFSASSADMILPFLKDRDIVIDGFSYIGRVGGTTGATVAILNRDVSVDTDIASTVTAARTVMAAIDVDAGNNFVANTPVDVVASSSYNRLPAGDQLVADFSGTLTNLADLFITMRYRTKRK